jgi:hypothetical protein
VTGQKAKEFCFIADGMMKEITMKINGSKALLFTTFLVASILLTGNLYAVDGYKNFKFGISKNQLMEKSSLTLTESNMGDKVTALWSEGFSFGGSKVTAYFYFIDDRFLRIAIEVPIDNAIAVAEGLNSKYEISSSSPQSSFEAVDSHPNMKAFLAFDSDTIYLNLASDEISNQSAMLLYTSPEFDALLLKNQKESLSNDL